MKDTDAREALRSLAEKHDETRQLLTGTAPYRYPISKPSTRSQMGRPIHTRGLLERVAELEDANQRALSKINHLHTIIARLEDHLGIKWVKPAPEAARYEIVDI